MTRRAKTLVALLACVALLSITGARADVLPSFGVVQNSDAFVGAFALSSNGPIFDIFANHVIVDGEVKTSITVWRVALPDRFGGHAIIQADALTISWPDQATLLADVDGIGHIDILMKLTSPNFTNSAGCTHGTFGFDLESLSGQLADGYAEHASGTIAGSPIYTAVCKTFGSFIDAGYWYALGII